MRSLHAPLAAALALAVAGVALADPPQDKPGLAKKVGLPPGLAKRFGADVPEKAWIAFHPQRDDGAWFLVDGQWTLMTGFSASVRAEVKEARKRPASAPPVPLPAVGVTLHVVLFEPQGGPGQ
jgi:hypothetical protein